MNKVQSAINALMAARDEARQARAIMAQSLAEAEAQKLALLDAAKALALDYEQLLGDGVIVDTEPSVLTKMRAAIAKAEGRA